ncbi:MAG: hypothetical protein J0M07_21025 [Anaerolineae bacterium]|uniref:hypothetical protein n=1 Tax=Candidatus Flexifilum breve TaxID=3140694 RepID=UPI001AD3AC70|nr:hypothetical protein [Chloroflexota bacterium]MBK9747092.1 hypothetical protein [Chloroflexota bacterium]MBN8637815.1 hypothetical protein [Anaerolineae bacterium]
MSLNTFGAILAFAIDLEARLRDYYQAAGNAGRAAEADKRRQNFERVRRENITEIKLEPIEGLHEADYALNLTDNSETGQTALEEIAAQFYTDVAPKINVREAQRALERAAKQHRELA